MRYLTGEMEEPASTHPVNIQKWKYENSMLMDLLVHSMKPSIEKTYYFWQGRRMFGTLFVKCTLTPKISLRFLKSKPNLLDEIEESRFHGILHGDGGIVARIEFKLR